MRLWWMMLPLALGACVAKGLQPPKPKMISVAGGSFTMGSSDSCSDEQGMLCGGDHAPHTVSVDAYQIADHEITRAEWGACELAGGCDNLLDVHHHRIDQPGSPMVVKSPTVAAEYCSWVGLRMPTEAEFELVQRGGDPTALTKYPWGDTDVNGGGDVTASGIHNLAGGVPEWVADGYNPAIGCPDRLTDLDVCPSASSSCGTDQNPELCLPTIEGGPGDNTGSLACAPGSVTDHNPLYALVFQGVGVVRGGGAQDRTCDRAGYTRRPVYPSVSFAAGFRCASSVTTNEWPSAYRFSLQGCPSGAMVDVSGNIDFQIDVFTNGTATTQMSSEMKVSGLPCDAVFGVHGATSLQITYQETNDMSQQCTLTWTGSWTPPGDSSGVAMLTAVPSGECTNICSADFMNDAKNCGYCFNACITGSSCANGACTCVPSMLETDPNNCGQCGNVCGKGAMCVAGACTCNADLSSDTHNCGTCGHDCLGGACVKSQCQAGVVASGLSSPFAVVGDVNGVFISNRVGPAGFITSCTFNLTTMSTNCAPLTNTDQPRPGLLALDSNNLYWGDFDNGHVLSCARGGCSMSPTPLDTSATGAIGVALQGGSLLYTANTAGAVYECVLPDCAGGRKTIVSGLASNGGGPYGIAADANNIYFTDNGSGALRSCPRAGCNGLPSENLLSNLNDPQQLILDQGSLFIAEHNSISIQRFNVSTLQASYVVNLQQAGVAGIATDATHLFWTNDQNGTVSSCLKSASFATPTLLATNQSTPTGIAVVGPALVWTNLTSNDVWGVAIPIK
jgi:Sulfatase-modifying factor enzyme 1/Stigma-specific protein, Stig1